MTRIVASVFSGVEANDVAIRKSGVPWRTDTVSEIEPFPCAVLKIRCPDARNLGDFTKINPAHMYPAQVLVGGPPCQSFSIAGGRKGLDDDRGNLTLKYVDLCHDLTTNGSLRVALYENVPGILSDKTNAFGCLISGLVGGVDEILPPGAKWGFIHTPLFIDTGRTIGGKPVCEEGASVGGTWGWQPIKWPSFGLAAGPRARLAWRTLDAQWFGLAQRRRRVFIVVSFDPDVDPAEILLERKSLQGNPAPCRQSGKGFAADVGNRPKTGSHWDGTECHPSLNQSANTGGIGASNQEVFSQRGAGLVSDIAHTLRGEGFDASEDGTGRGTPLTVETFRMVAFGEYSDDCTASTVKARDHKDATDLIAFSARQGVSGPLVGALDGLPTQAIAFAQNTRDEVRLINGDGAIAGALAAQPGAKQQSYIAEPFTLAVRGRKKGSSLEFRNDGLANALLTPNGGRAGIGVGAIATEYAVRRLMPVETERLQGFPDDWTQIPYRNKPAAKCPDGPRYKAMGNSWPVNVVAWIYLRIETAMTRADASSDDQPKPQNEGLTS